MGRNHHAQAGILCGKTRYKRRHRNESGIGGRRRQNRVRGREDLCVRFPGHSGRREGFRPSHTRDRPGERVRRQDRQGRETHAGSPEKRFQSSHRRRRRHRPGAGRVPEEHGQGRHRHRDDGPGHPPHSRQGHGGRHPEAPGRDGREIRHESPDPVCGRGRESIRAT